MDQNTFLRCFLTQDKVFVGLKQVFVELKHLLDKMTSALLLTDVLAKNIQQKVKLFSEI